MKLFIQSFTLFYFIALVYPCVAKERFTHITIKDGLSQSSVKCLHQDSKGFIWIGTADGLNKYDGFQFKTYRIDPNNTNSIGGNDISCIYENPYDSTLWIGTHDAGISIYNRDQNNFIKFGFNSESQKLIPSNKINDIITTDDNKLWAATQNAGICYFNPTDSCFVKAGFSSMAKFRSINCLEKDGHGNLWIGTPSGLFVWSRNDRESGLPKQVALTENTTSVHVSALEFDMKGNLWIGTYQKGLFVYHPSSEKLNYFNDKIRSIFNDLPRVHGVKETRDGNIWIATNDGLYRYDAQSRCVDVFKNDDHDIESINDNVAYSLLEDRSGIIWIGTFTGGLNKMDPIQYRFSKLNHLSSFNHNKRATNDIRSVHVDDSETTWIGTSSGLVELSLKKNDFNLIKSSVKIHLEDHFMGPITSTNDFLICSSVNGGILKMKKNGEYTSLSKQIEQQTGINISVFTSSVKDDYQNIWLGTATGLLQYAPDKNEFSLFNPIDPDNEIIKIYINTITKDHAGKIWIGTIDGKLYTFDIHTNEFELIISGKEYDKLISFNKIFSLCASIRNEVWIGSDRGLYRLNTQNGSIERFLDFDGLANNTVYGVVCDGDNTLWCSTNNGISSYETKEKRFQNYTYEDGLQSNEFNEGAYFADSEGVIYMGGIEGLNIFDPSKIPYNDFLPSVIISEMEIQYKEVTPRSHPNILHQQISVTQDLTLSYKQSTFNFKFAALSFSLPHRNKYQYSLTEKGNEDKWINADENRIATYTNVPPGEYTFKVKGSNSDGLWNETPTSINIVINPPFWQTLWFKVIMTLILWGVIHYIIFVRTRNIRRQKKKLKLLVERKTETLQIQKEQIESQNKELKTHNEKIEQKNKQLNDQHSQLVTQRNDLLQMAEQIEKANQAKFSFFTSVSHELRTPLTLIINPLKDLLEEPGITKTKETKRRLKNIYNNASKLLVTVNQLLDYRKIETNNMRMHVAEFDLVPFVQNAVLLFNELAVQKNIELSIKNSMGSTIKLWGDMDKLEKTIFNLLSNAFKFTPDGGTINIQLSLANENKEEFIKLSIKDNGIGIAPDKQEMIFDRFYQLDNPSAHQSSGSGLGLALVKEYIELHKGSITVESTLGKGCEITILLPTGASHFDDNMKFVENSKLDSELLIASISEHTPLADNVEQADSNGEKLTLLIIEDDDNLVAYMTEILSGRYSINIAKNGEKAFQMAKSINLDLIVCDVMLPDINGFKLCKELKSDFRTSHLPIILLTSLANQEAKLNGIKAGADDFITKPFDLQHLLLSIENLIEGRIRLQRRYSMTDPDAIEEDLLNSRDRRFLRNAIRCVEENLTNTAFNVEMFCSSQQLSQPQCYRKIKGITGLNISEFIRNTRLKKALKLLQVGEYKISEVAYETGFNDPNYFTKSFTKLYGMTPSEYIKASDKITF
ncbi:two-component regulator propeller domain-containing protein [Sunxiuqinia sp. sy24]|uniref:two-component regulator propeller domain-containing protein n=1 Tax=Sunxiuqinia sp. sy24 TaxID=3461495 RepID=UPI004045495C